MSIQPILPGKRIGVLGSGQLGRMLALAARNLGYGVAIYSPEENSPASAVADVDVVGDYLDLPRIHEFAKQVEVVTFEFENVPHDAAKACAEHAAVRPDGNVLHISQNRLREKNFLRENGFPTTPFQCVTSLADLEQAIAKIGAPGVLKTASFGYDGKGQVKIKTPAEAAQAWAAMKGAESIYEGFVDFVKEMSVIGARTLDGQIATFPVFENDHSNHILDITFAPAALGPVLSGEARQLACGILEKLEVVGLLTVEMFLTSDGHILVNELAPRTHNSGHLTIDACATSQFEQQVRAVCGLPLGSTEMEKPAAMANLLGHLWEHGEPDWAAALQDPLVKLHLYGKREARVGRKMGHLTATGETIELAIERVKTARERLTAKYTAK
jgi:5-(carboxyamino)imidazole ribonucleotide synthase